jgi:hypothetical protein
MCRAERKKKRYTGSDASSSRGAVKHADGARANVQDGGSDIAFGPEYVWFGVANRR